MKKRIIGSKTRRLIQVFLILMVGIFFTGFSENANAEVFEQWVKRYNGPANGADYAWAIATDVSGNIYVTGESRIVNDSDYATVAYDSSGNELWVKRYNGPGDGEDRAWAIAVDIGGNIYVTGTSYDSVTNWDYATVAYDSSGNELWVKRYNGPANDSDDAHAIAVDTSGKIYVTGLSYNGNNNDYLTIAYDSSGNELWVKRYNGPANGDDHAIAIAADASGNVYVTGSSFGIGADRDYATVAYDSSGKELWVRRYDGLENDEARDIAVHPGGNVYVTGGSYGGNWDYATVAYDTLGNELWVKRYDGGPDDIANAITMDTSGNIYVTGVSFGIVTGNDYATVAYDTLGNELWVKRYNGPANDNDVAEEIAVDAWGNVYVTGYSIVSGVNNDYTTVAYDSLGNELWVKTYNNSPGNYDDWAYAIAVDAWGNVYVTGSSGDSLTDNDYATIKYARRSEIDVDIMPGTCPNECNSKGGGFVEVAVLGTQDFDVTTIDTASIRLVYTIEDIKREIAPVRSSIKDVSGPPIEQPIECECITDGKDGLDDLLLKFDKQEVINTLDVPSWETLMLKITGVLQDGTPIEGEDCLKFIYKGGH